MTADIQRLARIFRAVPSIFAKIEGRRAAVAATLSLLFVLFTWLPLRPSGLFRDLVDARAISTLGGLPDRDPVLPYCDAPRFAVLNAGGALVELVAWDFAGVDGLVLLSAALACGAAALWMRLAARRAGEFSAAAPILLWTLAVEWGAYDAAGTHRFGRLLIPATLLLLDAAGLWRLSSHGLQKERSPERERLAAAALPIIFALWVNLDASWPIGLVVLWLAAVGRVVELRRARRAGGRSDGSIRRTLLVALASTLATLANPYGWKLWGLATLPLANNPFVAALGPAEPLVGWSLSGAFVLVALATAGVVLARRLVRWSAADSLFLLVGVVATFAHPLARVWTLPLVGLLVLPPLWREIVDALGRYASSRPPRRIASEADADAAWRDPDAGDRRSGAAGSASAFRGAPLAPLPLSVCGLALVGAVVLTPLGDGPLGRRSASLEQVVVDAPAGKLPADLFDSGVAFVPPWWSDLLAWEKLASGDAQVAGAPHGGSDSLVPQLRLLADSRQVGQSLSVREDVVRVLVADEGWTRILDRYDVKTLLVDARRQVPLLEAASADAHWREVARSNEFVLFAREERVR